MRLQGDLSRKTLWDVMRKGELPLPDNFDSVEEEARIEQDNANSTAFNSLGSSMLSVPEKPTADVEGVTG